MIRLDPFVIGRIIWALLVTWPGGFWGRDKRGKVKLPRLSGASLRAAKVKKLKEAISADQS